MLKPLLTSLRFQVGLAFLALLAVFGIASLSALNAFQRQIDYDTVVTIGARLELTAQQMHLQAMNYKRNAPRDYATYYRDLKLYYQDLMAQIALFDRVVDGFMSGDLSGEAWPSNAGKAPETRTEQTSGMPMPMPRTAPWLRPGTDDAPRRAIKRLEQTWATYRRGLIEAIGDDEEPRLEWAAEHIVAEHAPLENASSALTEALNQSANNEHRRIGIVALTLIGGTLITALVIMATLHYRALKPLQRTIAGFQRVIDGDFGHVIPVEGAAEIQELTVGFNAMTGRVHLLFLLIDRLQRGSNLDEVVGFLGRELRELLRFDWIGVVVVNPDQATVRIEASALDGALETGQTQLFRLNDTLLEQALAGGQPVHVAEMTATAAANPRFEFLRDLIRRDLHDAVFLPVASHTPSPAVVVFATRAASQYDQAHMRFLNNCAQLITESFGRTFRLAERGRLASIGEFASGIAHELRTPLATVTLAIEYFARLEQPPNARKRLELAETETKRMGRLIDDMLLYAKPLNLELKSLELGSVAAESVRMTRAQPCCEGREVVMQSPSATDLRVFADHDRLLQILVNLLRNACEASPDGAAVSIAVQRADQSSAEIEIKNGGAAIPPSVLARVFQPFVSAKQGGTGLGLAIVQRLVNLLGGEVELRSTQADGTSALVTLPLRDPGDDASCANETGGEGKTHSQPHKDPFPNQSDLGLGAVSGTSAGPTPS